MPAASVDPARNRRRSLAAEAAFVSAAVLALLRVNPFALASRWIGDIDVKYYGWLAWRLGELSSPTLRLDGVVHPAGLELTLLDGLAPISLSGVLARFTGRYLAVNLVIIAGIAGNYLAARRLARVVAEAEPIVHASGRGSPPVAHSNDAGAGTSGTGVRQDDAVTRPAVGSDGGRGGGATESPTGSPDARLHRQLVAIVCGLAFAAAPLFASPAASFPPLLWAFPVPLLLAEVIPAARGQRGLRRAVVAGLLVLAYLCSIYHLLFGALAAVLVACCWPASALRSRAGLARGGVATAVALVVLSPFVVARLQYNADEHLAGADPAVRLAEARVFSADLADPIVLPSVAGTGTSLRLGLPVRPLEVFRSAAVGWALLAGLVLAATRRQMRAAMLIPPAALLVLSWGPRLVAWGRSPTDTSWLPYRVLLAVPGLSALRAPYRAGFALAAVLVIALATGLAGRSHRMVGAVVVLAVVSWWPRVPTSTAAAPAALASAFAGIAGSPDEGAVLVVPFTCSFDDLDVLNWQVAHRRPMVTCGVSTSATRWDTRGAAWFDSPGLAATRCDPAVDVLGRPSGFPSSSALDDAGIADLRDRLGVRWVVFDAARAAGCPTAAATASALSAFPPLASDDRYTLVDIGP